MTTILIVAGDPSGDLHGAGLIRALKSARPGLKVAAVGGPYMREACDEFLEDLASRGVTGFWEPVLKLRFLTALALGLRRFMRERKPIAVVCIDYYGFNRRVLGIAQSAGVPAFYYISPQVWASRPGRVKVLKRLLRKMLVIFPFEEKVYAEAGVPVSFVGHPLLDLLPEPSVRGGIGPAPLIGILPGSRRSEIARHLPLMLESYARLKARFPGSQACVFAAASQPDSVYEAAKRAGLPIVRERDYAKRKQLDLALCSSGTATLENALLGVPMVVVYRMSRLTYWIARALIRVRYIAMANLLADRGLVPELIQDDAIPGKVSAAAEKILLDGSAYAALRNDLLALRGKLGGPGAAGRAAAEILAEAGA